ncbi:MAG: ATP-dependent DNA helicase [Candidatus Aminicenantes bacterium]|nr:ATP-dependent DNA helicase [Candidatus Aminicenantes bacterium]
MPRPARMRRQPEERVLLEGLNPAQRRAVLHGEGPLLIVAGAGTGKTKVITHRIARLIAVKAARPAEILAVTFTEKAANEMEARVDVLVPYTSSFAEISTFNSFGERVLRDYALDAGYPPDFRLLADVDQAIFFRENLFRLPLDYYRPLGQPTRHIQEVLEAIRRLKQEDVRPEDYVRYAEELGRRASGDPEKETARKHLEIARVFAAYQALLRAEGLIDFEDQVTLVVDLLRRRPAVLDEIRRRYRYILVDEFQDTNFVQFELVKMLAAEHRNLTVVGDDDQSIFRFRGASLSNILGFEEVFPEADRIVLTRNYRSTQPILDASYRLIRHNDPNQLEFKDRVDKRLRAAARGRGKSIHMLSFDTLAHEADAVAGRILEIRAGGAGWRDMAVLVRRNADAEPYLRSFNMKQIPFRFSGSRGLYQQEEIKVLVAFIRAVTDFENSRDLFYLALSEVYRADPYDLSRIAGYADKKNLSLHGVFKSIAEGPSPVDLPAATTETVKRIFADILASVELAGTKNAGAVVYAFLEKSGYLKSLVGEMTPESEVRIKNVRLFFDKIQGFSGLVENDSIRSFARYLDLLAEVGDNPATSEAELDEDAVNVLTVHKAKGLEFGTVFLVGLIEDRFPGRERRERVPVPDGVLKESLPGRENFLQEERRLFYVAMTRARRALQMTWARDYGTRRFKRISPFVLEALDIPKMPEDVLKASVLEEIRRYALATGRTATPAPVRPAGMLRLSFVRVEDYLVCPLKYKFRHDLRVPVLPHHAIVFGRVLHKTIHAYLKRRMTGRAVDVETVIGEYRKNWVNEGFLSREHEELRKAAGEKALRLFYEREEESGRRPAFLERPFRWQERGLRFAGRFDRIDFEAAGAAVIDFKTTDASSQKEADRAAAESLQLDVYALSFLKTEGMLPYETRLYFLESGFVGRAAKGEKELARAGDKIREAADGIRSGGFKARPDWHSCSICEFKTICPSSFAY